MKFGCRVGSYGTDESLSYLEREKQVNSHLLRKKLNNFLGILQDPLIHFFSTDGHNFICLQILLCPLEIRTP